MSLVAEVTAHQDGFVLDARLEVGDGEVVALLGPNGAGKTSLLRVVAGLQRPTAGRVEIGGVVVDDVTSGHHASAAERRVGMVFQDHLLFPHLDLVDNVAFGPRSRGSRRRDARRVALDWLERVGLDDRADARPSALSGGQAQRVALARALAGEPAALLLDEPLAALDVETRQEVRGLLRDHLRAFAGPAIVVTHDPLEALTLADRLVVLEHGRVSQSGTPAEVARRPRSAWVARLVGVNLVRGTASGTEVAVSGATLTTAEPADGPVDVLFHPHAVALHRVEPAGSPRNTWRAVIDGMDVEGARVRVHLDGPLPVVSEVTPAAVAELGLADGVEVWAAVKAVELQVEPN